MYGAYIIGAIVMMVSMAVSQQLKNKFRKYSQMALRNGMSGAEIAEQMLLDNGIRDVKVQAVRGMLTDHYNPANKTVNLSEGVYSQRSAAAAAVAAHECGHAVQHATAYRWLQMRSKLVPVVSISSKFVQWVLLAGIVMVNTFPELLLIGILMFGAMTLFSVVTLPVEYDASHRALQWMESEHIVTDREHDAAKDALKWAARTYLVAAIGSIATLLYYLSIFLSARRR
jgi:Zn-dependent membrane protease YugP